MNIGTQFLFARIMQNLLLRVNWMYMIPMCLCRKITVEWPMKIFIVIVIEFSNVDG
jgi:hypothetical protein